MPARLNDVFGGVVTSVLSITYGLSYAVLIFTGPLAPFLPYGIAATFVSASIAAAVLALCSSFPFAVAGPTVPPRLSARSWPRHWPKPSLQTIRRRRCSARCWLPCPPQPLSPASCCAPLV
jgi:hypothetical protein